MRLSTVICLIDRLYAIAGSFSRRSAVCRSGYGRAEARPYRKLSHGRVRPYRISTGRSALFFTKSSAIWIAFNAAPFRS